MIFPNFASELWPLVDFDWAFNAHLTFLQHEKRAKEGGG